MDPEDAKSSSTASEEEYDGDLNDDLYEGLSKDFEFTGSFYHRSVEPSAPNPGLKIDGVGIVGLPLGERDAQAIISKAAQAPFGKGVETVVDTSIRDTWEIEPSAVSFVNEMWEPFVEQLATKTVWTTLGVAPYSTKPRCELYKLLLYQKGSHFLPHQDTEKSPGMFATIIVVLPSAFEGGEVHVSHSGRTEVLDVSQRSLFNTSVLAWYTDVVHEVKPITSGYRLALSYNLIHTSPNLPRPVLPTSGGALDDLRKTLERWNADKYDSVPSPPFFAYMLTHQYSQQDLNRGVEALKGKDAYLVAHLRQLFDELGFTLCLANLKKTESGSADDCGGGYGYGWGKRRRWGYDEYSDDHGDVTMLEVESSSLTLSNFVRITANGPVKLGADTHDLDQESLVPRDAFDDEEPDDQDYEGYMGNYAGTLEQWYNRSALVFFKKSDETSIILDLCGPTAVLKTLDLTSSPTPTALQMVKIVLEKQPDGPTASIVLSHAIAWKDHNTWNKAIPFVVSTEGVKSAITSALKVFQVEMIKPGLAALVKRQKTLELSFNAVQNIASLLEGGTHGSWIEELKKDALTSYTTATPSDIPTLLRLAKEGNAGIISSSVIPKTKALPGKYDFHIALANACREQENSLSEQGSPPGHREAFATLAREALTAAVEQVKSPTPTGPVVYPSYMRYHTQPTAVLSPTALKERIGSLIKTCLSTGQDTLCVEIFNKAGVENQMEVLSVIRANVGTASPVWAKDLVKVALASYSTPALSDIPTLSWIAGEVGPESVERLVSEKIAKTATYDILIGLAKSLHERYSLVSRSPQTPEETKASLRRAVMQCIRSVIPRWEQGAVIHAPYAYGFSYGRPAVPAQQNGVEPNAKVKRVLEIVELCFTVGDLSPCVALFKNLTDIPATVKIAERFQELHTPLITHLKQTLKKHGKGTQTEPFKSFFKNAVSLYLARILGVNTPPAQPPVFPKTTIGCGCSECRDLNSWLKNAQPEHRLCAVQARRTHLEREIQKAVREIGHLVTMRTEKYGSPHTLVVSKKPEVMAALTWTTSQQAAVAFVRKVADDRELRELMGGRYGDVMAAVQGTRVFVPGRLEVAAPEGISASAAAATAAASTVGSAMAGPSAAASGSGSGSGVQQVAQAETVVGVKRKKSGGPPANTIAFIDLT